MSKRDKKPKTLAEVVDEVDVTEGLSATMEAFTDESTVVGEPALEEEVDEEFKSDTAPLTESTTNEDFAGLAPVSEEPDHFVDEVEVYGVSRLKVLKKQKKYINGHLYIEVLCEDRATYLLTVEEHKQLVKTVR